MTHALLLPGTPAFLNRLRNADSTCASGMRLIDSTHMRVVHCGKRWTYSTDPCSKDMIKHLERNESIISWLQPDGKGVEEQVPCIIVGDHFAALSLRMMKAVWRHVRLKKGFVNTEPLSHGESKLKIPSLLLQEKIRTQNRFNVRAPPVSGIHTLVSGIHTLVYTPAS